MAVISLTVLRGQNTMNYPEENSADMSDHQGTPSVGKRVGEFLILGIYLAFDVAEGWHRSHLLALVAAFGGIVALLLLDGGFSRKSVLWTLALSFVGCVIIFFVTPPILPEETETHGWLESANEPLPSRDESACVADELEVTHPNGMLFSLGKAGMWFAKKSGGKRPLLTVGACTLMYGEFKNDQFLFSADIYDSGHQLVARIERNEFHLVRDKYAYQTRPDRSTLSVYDKEGKLLLSVHRRNKDAMLVTGDFTCSDGKEAKVEGDGKLTMTGPKGTLTWGQDCLINTGGFKVTESGFGIGRTPCWACVPSNPLCTNFCEPTHK